MLVRQEKRLEKAEAKEIVLARLERNLEKAQAERNLLVGIVLLKKIPVALAWTQLADFEVMASEMVYQS